MQKTATYFASEFRQAWWESKQGILQAAELVAEAHSRLNQQEFRKMGSLLGVSASTLSKLILIHKHRQMLELSRGDLLEERVEPVRWQIFGVGLAS